MRLVKPVRINVAKTYKHMKGDEMLKSMAKKMQPKKEESYEMPKSEAVKEHKRLVKVLRSGDKKTLLKEADLQEKELKEIISEDSEEDEGESED